MKNKKGLGSGATLFVAVILCVMLIFIFGFLFKSLGRQEAPPVIAGIKDVNSHIIMDSYLLSEVGEGDILTLINLHETERLKSDTSRIMNNFIGNVGRYKDICWSVEIRYSGTDQIRIDNGPIDVNCQQLKTPAVQLYRELPLINKKSTTVQIII